MKKMMTALAVLLTSGLALAAVESQVVGYNTIELTKPATLIAVNFDGIASENLNIQEAFPYANGMTKGRGLSEADTIQVLTASGGYDVYYMSSGRNGKNQIVEGLEGKWAEDGQYTPSSIEVPAGTAAWYIAKNASPDAPVLLTVAGQVANDAMRSHNIAAGLNLIGNPFPTPLILNEEIPFVPGMEKGRGLASADSIQIQNSAGGYDVYYMSNGRNGKNQIVEGLEGKWSVDGQYEVATEATIPSGGSAWYIARGGEAFDLEIARPFDF